MITPEDEKLVETGIKAATSEALRPFTDLITKLAGPAAEELGLTLQDSVKVYRFKRRIRLLQKIKEICDGAGIEPHAVPLKILLPSVEYASMEENDDLQDRWAALLANSALQDSNCQVLPAFVDILRQVTPIDAQFFDLLFEGSVVAQLSHQAGLPFPDKDRYLAIAVGATHELFELHSKKFPIPSQGMWWMTSGNQTRGSPAYSAFMLSLDNLVRLGLLLGESPLAQFTDKPQPPPPNWNERIYYVTTLGYEFLKACRAPKRKAESAKA